MPFRYHVYFYFALLVICSSLTSCSESTQSTQSVSNTTQNENTGLAVSIAHAEMRQIERSVIASGPVSAWEEMQLGVELSGLRITALNVDVGQAVKKDQVVLELDHRMLDSDVRQAQAAFSEAEAGVALAKTNLKRGEALAETRMISASALDELRAAHVQAQAHLATARAHRDTTQLRRQFADLRAPDDGIIAKRLAQPGQITVTGAELLRLIRQGRLEWRAELSPNDLPRVHAGAKAWINSSDGVIEGRVRAVTPGIDTATRTGTAYVDLPKSDALRAGVFAQGKIATGNDLALMVPSISIVRRDGYAYVFTIRDKNTVQRQRVQLGINDSHQTEIVTGLKAGNVVIARGAGFLSDGDKVQIVETHTTQTHTKTTP